MCNATLNVKELRRIVKEKSSTKKTGGGAGSEPELLKKPDALLKILKDNPDGKIIVFSRYENPFGALAREISDAGVVVEMVQGSKDSVGAILRRFREGQTRVLLLDSKYCGAGINLESATHVVLYHGGLSHDERHQIVGRAQRLGRTGPLTVVQLLHEAESP
jgi:superfamily II DNA/RNA helicase